jgi:hypothetical protein
VTCSNSSRRCSAIANVASRVEAFTTVDKPLALARRVISPLSIPVDSLAAGRGAEEGLAAGLGAEADAEGLGWLSR